MFTLIVMVTFERLSFRYGPAAATAHASLYGARQLETNSPSKNETGCRTLFRLGKIKAKMNH
jgi:hypothetical protein